MSDPHYDATRDFIPHSQHSHPFSLSIPPPPLPPSNIPPPSTFHPLSIPPTFPPPMSTPFFDQTFQSGGMYSEPPWSTSDQRTNQQCVLEDIFSEKSFSKSDSQDWVDGWLGNKRTAQVTLEGQAKMNVKIYVFKEEINSAFKLIKELENGTRTLSVMVKSVTPAEWEQKCEEIEAKKKELVEVLNKLQLGREEMNSIKDKCSKRLKKRARLRRQAERRKKLKEEDEVRCQNLHFQIDNWQREMQEGVERTQREEELQREADAVLWGVTHKKAEARRQVALLSALLELRHVRVQRLTAAGKPASHTQIHTFNTVIERLKKMWTKHLDECLLEEQALRGMLSDAVVKEDPVKTYKKLVLQEWQTALFGSDVAPDSNLMGNKLVNIRRDWDQFAVQDSPVLSSTIPPGWVLPVPPSSDQWHSLLKY